MTNVDIIVQLVQIGGIAGTLAFLLLGYFLLAAEQAKPQPNPATFDAIYKFLRYALVFFVVGIGAQILVPAVQDTLRRWNQPEVVQLIFDRWNFEPGAKKAAVSFSEASFADTPVVEKSSRGDYAVYVGLRARQAVGARNGEYPVLLGPLDFSSARNVEKVMTDAQAAALGGGASGSCIQFVLFGVEKSAAPLTEPFKPSELPTPPIVFNNVYWCG